MTTEQDKAVALAEKHGIQVAKGEHDFGVFPQSLVAMFAEYREELAQRSGLPEITEEDRQFLYYNPNTSDLVDFVQRYAREAIASLEARLEQQDKIGWDNFNALQKIDNYLIGEGLLQITHDGGPEAAAQNIIDSISILRKRAEQSEARVRELAEQNGRLKKSLIGHRSRLFPGTDQRSVVELDYPDLATNKESGKC